MGFFDSLFHDKNSDSNHFEWMPLASVQQWTDIVSKSETGPVAVFKHSPRCAVSRMALSTFEREWEASEPIPLYMLSVLEAREVSNQIASDVEVRHESPQLLLVHKGQAVAHWSHQHIDAATLQRHLQILKQ